MREITTHRVTPASERLTVSVLDDPGPGGASHAYGIAGFDPTKNPSASLCVDRADTLHVLFQNGTIQEGVNGVTEQALLAILIDRIESFQAGPFSCFENDQMLKSLRQALSWSHARTRDRTTRGVEGKYEA